MRHSRMMALAAKWRMTARGTPMVVDLNTIGDPLSQVDRGNRFAFDESLPRFMLAWLPATLLPPVAIALAFFLVIAVAQVGARDSSLRLLCLLGLFPSIIVAFAIGASASQSRALRRRLPDARRWGTMTALGALGGLS